MRPRLAVILAAGRGLRLGQRGREIPKGFIPIAGTTLIERSLGLLRGAGVERVCVVTGHLADHYERLAAQEREVTLVHNAAFATTGSLSSLLCAGPIDEPYLLVESDLLFEARAPRLLAEAVEDDLLLASGPTGSGDEVHVGSEHGVLTDLSKRREELRGTAVGELVGLTRISPALHAEIMSAGAELLAASPRVEYESALVAAGRRRPLSVLCVPDLLWTEIDDEHQLARATTDIAPRLGL